MDSLNSTKAIKATLHVDEVTQIDCFNLQSGEKRVSYTDSAKALHVPLAIWSRIFDKSQIQWVELQCGEIHPTIAQRDFVKVLTTRAFSGDSVSIEILSGFAERGIDELTGEKGAIKAESLFRDSMLALPLAKQNKSVEKDWQNKLAEKLDAKTEVSTPVGKIDLLSDSIIGEVKECSLWKHGMGQLQAYSHFYPSHRKVLYLFGDCKNRSDVIHVCALMDIEVVFKD